MEREKSPSFVIRHKSVVGAEGNIKSLLKNKIKGHHDSPLGDFLGGVELLEGLELDLLHLLLVRLAQGGQDLGLIRLLASKLRERHEKRGTDVLNVSREWIG